MIDKSISIVIPVYNEEKIIIKTLIEVHTFLEDNFFSFEIIVVDDASSDMTYSKLVDFPESLKGIKILKNKVNCGKGFSVRKGVLFATCEYIAFSDADLSTPISELRNFIDYFQAGADVVIGSRALKKSKIIKSQGIIRRNMGRFFNSLVQLFLFRGIKDTQCGFKCFKKDAAKELFKLQRLSRFCFDVEILYIAKKRGYLVKEVPVRWSNRENSRVSMLGDSFSMFLDLFQIRLNSIRRFYDK